MFSGELYQPYTIGADAEVAMLKRKLSGNNRVLPSLTLGGMPGEYLRWASIRQAHDEADETREWNSFVNWDLNGDRLRSVESEWMTRSRLELYLPGTRYQLRSNEQIFAPTPIQKNNAYIDFPLWVDDPYERKEREYPFDKNPTSINWIEDDNNAKSAIISGIMDMSNPRTRTGVGSIRATKSALNRYNPSKHHKGVR